MKTKPMRNIMCGAFTLLFGATAFGLNLKVGSATVVKTWAVGRESLVQIDGYAALPATLEVAQAFDRLVRDRSYRCNVSYYAGATGWSDNFEGQLSTVHTTYAIDSCVEQEN